MGLKCGGKVLPVDVEHARALGRGATASIVKAKVRKWSAKKSPAAEAKDHKRHGARASSSSSSGDTCDNGQLAGSTAAAYQGSCAEVGKPDVG